MINYYVQGLITAVREVVAQHVPQMSAEDQQSFSAVRQVAAAVGLSQRALTSEKNMSARGPSDENPKAIKSSKQVLLTPPAPRMVGNSTFDMTDPSNTVEGTSIIDVAVDLGSIFFASAMADTPKEGTTTAPIGDEKILSDFLGRKGENPLMRDQVGIPSLSEGQIRQEVTVIPADYWTLSCWTCRQEGHSTYGCPYLTADQRLYFSYRYYLYQIQTNPQMAKYLEQRLEWRLAKDKGKTQVADGFVRERLRNFDDRRGGAGRVSAERFERNVKSAPRGFRRTPYPGSVRDRLIAEECLQ